MIIYQHGRLSIVTIRESYGIDYYAYVGEKLIRTCPSIGMAHEVLAGYPA